jgi:hypothetical protein
MTPMGFVLFLLIVIYATTATSTTCTRVECESEIVKPSNSSLPHPSYFDRASLSNLMDSTQTNDDHKNKQERRNSSDLHFGYTIPPWPLGFGDRLEVLKFNYTKDANGKIVLGDNSA